MDGAAGAGRVCAPLTHIYSSPVLFVFGNDGSTSPPRPTTAFPPWRRAAAAAEAFAALTRSGVRKEISRRASRARLG